MLREQLNQMVVGGMGLVTAALLTTTPIATIATRTVVVVVVVVVVMHIGSTTCACNIVMSFSEKVVTNVAGLKDEQGCHEQAQPQAT